MKSKKDSIQKLINCHVDAIFDVFSMAYSDAIVYGEGWIRVSIDGSLNYVPSHHPMLHTSKRRRKKKVKKK